MEIINISNKNSMEYYNTRKLFLDVRKETFYWLNTDKLKLDDFDKETQGEIILAAKIKKQIIGMVSIWERDKFIHHLYVHKDYRRIGIAKRLIAECIRLVGVPLSLKCLVKNEKAIQFYHQNNWKVIEKNMCDDGEYFLLEYK